MTRLFAGSSRNPVQAAVARANTEWVKRKVIKEDGTKGYCEDYRQETDPSCWQKKKRGPFEGRQPLGPSRKFAGGAPRIGSMHEPHITVVHR